MRTASRLPILVLAFALAGILDAGYDSYAIYMGQPLWCPPPIDGCNTVASSPYARVGGVPLGYLGVVYYLGMAAIAALLVATPGWRSGRPVAFVYASFGVLASAVFFYIQLKYIHAFCIYCLVSACLTMLLCLTTFLHHRRGRRRAVRFMGLTGGPA